MPTPTDPEPTPADPEPTEPPEPVVEEYDVTLQVSTTRSGHGVTRILVTVTGLPADRTATLASRGEGLVVALATDWRCAPSGVHTSRRTVDATPAGYEFLAHAPRPGPMSFEVAVDGDGTDSDPANNHSSVRVS